MIRVFCDFDGTITKKDMIISYLEEFNPPQWREIVERILAKELTQGEGLQLLYRKIPSSNLSRLLLHVMDTADVREGFGDFVAYCSEREFALSVISGGLEEFVRPIVEPYGVTSIWANHVNTDHDFMELVVPYRCDEGCEAYGKPGIPCAPCKPSVIGQAIEKGDIIYVIGDSVSDLKMAKVADHVFAREYLLKECQSQGLPHTAYETFYDVIEGMEHVTENL